MPSPNLAVIKSYLLPEEKQVIVDRAARLQITVSEYLRRVALGTSLPTFGKDEAILDLMKINANLARTGNLMKLTLDVAEENNIPINTSKIEETRAMLVDTQNILKQKLKEL